MQVKKKRQRKRTRINLIRFFSFIVIIASIIYSTRWIIFESGLLDIKMISVSGNTEQSDMQIINATGIELGNNVLFLNRRLARSKILSDAVYNDAKFTFKFPSRLEIKVIERKAVVIINNSTGWFYELDKDGIVFERKYNVSELPDVPFVTIPGIKLEIGKYTQDSLLRQALQLCTLFPDDFRKNVSEITFDNNKSLVVYMNNDMKVYWGDNLNFKGKYNILGEVMRKIKEENYQVEYVDVRYGENPVIKLKVGQ